MKTAIEITALLVAFACGSVVAWAVLALVRASRQETREAEQRLDAKTRHPAGTKWEFADTANPCVDTPIRSEGSAVTFDFRARICGHLLRSPSLDGIEMEHLELLHESECHLVKDLMRRDAA